MAVFWREAELTKRVSCRHGSSPLISIPPQWDVPSSPPSHPLSYPQQKQHVAIIPELCTCHLNSQEAAKQKLNDELAGLINSPGLFFNGGSNFILSFLYTEVSFHETRQNLIVPGILMTLTNCFKAEAFLSFDWQRENVHISLICLGNAKSLESQQIAHSTPAK